MAALGKTKLRMDGGGVSVRSFLYSSDIASGIIAALERGEHGETYHFSTDEFPTIRNVIEQVGSVMNVEVEAFAPTAQKGWARITHISWMRQKQKRWLDGHLLCH